MKALAWIMACVFVTGCASDQLYWKEDSEGRRLYETRDGKRVEVDRYGIIWVDGKPVTIAKAKEEKLTVRQRNTDGSIWYSRESGSTLLVTSSGVLYETITLNWLRPWATGADGSYWYWTNKHGPHLRIGPDGTLSQPSGEHKLGPDEDWDLSAYDVVPTGKCVAWGRYEPESCWNWLWKAPALVIMAPLAVIAVAAGSGSQTPSTYDLDTTFTKPQGGLMGGGYLGPYKENAYGPGIHSDATGRPFRWKPDGVGPDFNDPFLKVKPDAYGPGIGMDQYGRPVRPACPPGWAGPC